MAAVWPLVYLSTPLNALVFVWDGIFMAAERFRFLAISMLLASSLGAFVFILSPILGWGLLGIWSGMLVINLGRAAFQGWGYFKARLV